MKKEEIKNANRKPQVKRSEYVKGRDIVKIYPEKGSVKEVKMNRGPKHKSKVKQITTLKSFAFSDPQLPNTDTNTKHPMN